MGNPSITIPENFKISHEQFKQLANINRDLRLERTAAGELIILLPTDGNTGICNLEITGQLWLWNWKSKLGKVFNSSTGFTLPNGAIRSPDASWIKLACWEALTQQEKEGFAPVCPDFVVELLSPSDKIATVREKMQEYMDNGTVLGWLIDRKNRQVEIYRKGQDVEILNHPATLSGENVLPGFILELAEIWR